jgi:hypothetical protein
VIQPFPPDAQRGTVTGVAIYEGGIQMDQFKCQQCGQEFPSQEQLQRHNQEQHQRSDRPQQPQER